jgi:hypothetical protein
MTAPRLIANKAKQRHDHHSIGAQVCQTHSWLVICSSSLCFNSAVASPHADPTDRFCASATVVMAPNNCPITMGDFKLPPPCDMQPCHHWWPRNRTIPTKTLVGTVEVSSWPPLVHQFSNTPHKEGTADPAANSTKSTPQCTQHQPVPQPTIQGT